MWCLSAYLLKKNVCEQPYISCIFIKKSQTEFEIFVVYVDDLSLARTSK